MTSKRWWLHPWREARTQAVLGLNAEDRCRGLQHELSEANNRSRKMLHDAGIDVYGADVSVDLDDAKQPYSITIEPPRRRVYMSRLAVRDMDALKSAIHDMAHHYAKWWAGFWIMEIQRKIKEKP